MLAVGDATSGECVNHDTGGCERRRERGQDPSDLVFAENTLLRHQH